MFTEDVIDQAYSWLCQQRKHHPSNSDIWDLRFHWMRKRQELLLELNAQTFCFSPLRKIRKANGDVIHLWSAKDALVLKALSLILGKRLKLSKSCTHIKGHGGMKATLRQIQRALPNHKYVCRTDVKGYYAHIDHMQLMEKLSEEIKEPYLRRLVWFYMLRTIEEGGIYRTIHKGLSRGCPLSPLMGALYLRCLDEQFESSNLYYVRYMDDILILAPTRWKLRNAVKKLNQILADHGMEKHPDKTFIGRIERGFDFLGYHLSRARLTLAATTALRHAEHYHRLYEQLRKRKATSNEMALVLGDYVSRWRRWCTAGLRGLNRRVGDERTLYRANQMLAGGQ